MEIFYIRATQYGSHKPHVVLNTWNVPTVTEETKILNLIYFRLI